jgi:hypothetical protein
MQEPLEISDVIVDYDPATLARVPVRKADARARLVSANASRKALRILDAMPETSGVLDPDHVDGVLVRSHGELQRLSEEFVQGRRVAALLKMMVDVLRAAGVPEPYRVVDVGCGTGYVLRYLAASNALPGVRLIGADYNAALVALASRLAREESLDCEFHVANAFALAEPATFYLSTGVIHHFRGESLDAFFAAQAKGAPEAFIHFDIQHSPVAALGAWIFHQARMREPLAVHDGVMSAARAHPYPRLRDAIVRSAPGYAVGQHNKRIPLLPMVRAMYAVFGIRQRHVAAMRAHPMARAWTVSFEDNAALSGQRGP